MTDDLADRIAELEAELHQRDDKIKELTNERDEALELVNRIRLQVEDAGENIESWIEVFDMQLGNSGNWMWDPSQSVLWDKHRALLDEHNKLIREWNKFIGEYNTVVQPRERGRPLAASKAQQSEVLKQHKKRIPLRGIAATTGLSLRTVRTIIDTADQKGRAAKRTNLLRRRELDRRRAAAFRARHRARDQLPEKIAEVQKTGMALIKEVKGLGRDR